MFHEAVFSLCSKKKSVSTCTALSGRFFCVKHMVDLKLGWFRSFFSPPIDLLILAKCKLRTFKDRPPCHSVNAIRATLF